MLGVRMDLGERHRAAHANIRGILGMPKFHVNKRYSSNKHSVEADTYMLQDGYFNFVDEKSLPVFTLAANLVYTIEREDASQQS